jgi:hypothetical protein
MNEIEKIKQEYVLSVDGLDFSIKGRISERINGTPEQRFSWRISHYCRPSEKAAGVYYPSKLSFSTFKDAEETLLSYLTSFTTIDVTPNNRY